MEEGEPTEMQYKKRWFAYFDLLGFKNLVRNNIIEYVSSIYEDVLRILEDSVKPHRKHGISSSWFSDTMIIFSKGDSEEEFAYVEQASRVFFQRLILNKIPVRGALTVGELNIDEEKNIFVGEALIDAYECAENQKWLGFTMTPGVYSHLEKGSIPLKNRAFYRLVDMPEYFKNPPLEKVYAFAFNNNGQGNSRNPYLKAIVSMKAKAKAKAKAETDEVRKKYINTEKFIRKHGKLTAMPEN